MRDIFLVTSVLLVFLIPCALVLGFMLWVTRERSRWPF